MSVTPRGMSIQEAYRLYRDGDLLVNRRYQRKLVWTIEEKRRLIDSILKGYPIPLILLAKSESGGMGKYEIIDGIQRFNAVFSFIENFFSVDDKYFDVSEFTRAKQLAEAGVFDLAPKDALFFSPEECADLLDYQLAVTIYPTSKASEITDIFGRINSGGKQLSTQEKRQAGVVNPFADTIRQIASELRGDASKEILLLSEMPEISIETSRERQGYGLTSDETFWCRQGILRNKQLRDSEDEQMIADIAASVLLDRPLASSRELLDKLYDENTNNYRALQDALATYTPERLAHEIKTTFSVLRETIDAYSSEPKALRQVVHPTAGGNPTKTAFYAVFMAFFDLIVREECSPDNSQEIMRALDGLHSKLNAEKHHTTTRDREQNIDITKGLVTKYFIKKDPPVLRHGPGLALDFENALRRSKIETPRYEFKQGLLRLFPTRELDTDLISKLIKTMCAIANLGPESDGYIFLGVADKEKDAQTIQRLDKINPIKIADHSVVGIDREYSLLDETPERYVGRLLDAIRNSQLGDPLKTQLLSKIDVVSYKGYSVIRITIPAQRNVTFVGDQAFVRDGSSTVAISGPQLLAVNDSFKNSTRG